MEVVKKSEYLALKRVCESQAKTIEGLLSELSNCKVEINALKSQRELMKDAIYEKNKQLNSKRIW